MLGARAFLRGYDYVRRRAVGDLALGDSSAKGSVRGTEPDPYAVSVQLTPNGFSSQCTCAAFGKINGHCKHVAALLIALRDSARGPRESDSGGDSMERDRTRRAAGPGNGNGGGDSGLQNGNGNAAASGGGGNGGVSGVAGVGWSSSHGFGAAPSSPDLEGGRRGKRGRAARAAQKQAERRGNGAGGGANGAPAGHGGHGGHVSVGTGGGHGRASGSGTVSTGIDAWLPEPLPPLPKTIEYRLQVRAGALVVSLFNPDTRTAISPSALLAAQAETPTADRGALRLLARFESEGHRRNGGIEVRGEDAADLLPFLKGRRVIVEPQMMELRFGDEPLRPRFDLELSADGAQVLVKSSFQRSGDPRKFTTAHGAWFEGSPGWFLDPQEGVARPLDRRVSSAAIHRLTRAPFIHEAIERLPALIAQGLPKVALEVGAELPDLSQVAEVVDLVPTFRMRAGGSLVEAHVSLRAAYEDTEIDVRADGMTPPVIVKAPEPRNDGKPQRARCIRCDIVSQQDAAGKLRELGLAPDEHGNGFIARGDDAIQFWTEGIGALPEDWDLFVPDDLVDVQVRTERLGASARVGSGVDWLSLRLSFESEGVAVSQEELGRCLAEGRRYVRLADGSFARLDAQKVRDVLQRQAEILATGGGQGGKLPLSQAGRLQELLEQVNRATVSTDAKDLFTKLRDVDEIKGAKKPRNLKASLRPYQEQGFH